MSKVDEVTDVLPGELRQRMVSLDREEDIPRLPFGGVRITIKFENSFSAVVINNVFSFGGDEGLWEINILDADGYLIDTVLGDHGIMGWLTAEEVVSALDSISKLEKE